MAVEDIQTIEPYKALRRFTPEVTHELRRIDATLERIKSADIWPASAEALRFSAQVGTIHYSTLIEGNRLGVLEAERAARGELDARTRAEIELVNQVDALRLLDQRMEADGLRFSEDLFKKLHYEVTKGLGTKDGPFYPRHEGDWRDGEAGVWDPISQMLIHTGSPQRDVRPRMLGLIDWVNAVERRPVEWPVPVIAGVVHYNVAEVHPFADGNGRTSRLLAAALLARHGYTPGHLFNFDAHYGLDKDAYLDALRSVRHETFNLETWMRYFLSGLANEYERVAQEIDRLGVIGRTDRGERVQLTDKQQKALTALVMSNRVEFSRRDYEQAGGVARTAAGSDLSMLADAGVLRRVGDGTARRYRFASAPPGNPWTGPDIGRPRIWSDERIRGELEALVAGTGRFPTIKRFDEAGARPLYEAIQRHGGSAEWAERLGIRRSRAKASADSPAAGGR
jgi:Fic family protein